MTIRIEINNLPKEDVNIVISLANGQASIKEGGEPITLPSLPIPEPSSPIAPPFNPTCSAGDGKAVWGDSADGTPFLNPKPEVVEGTPKESKTSPAKAKKKVDSKPKPSGNMMGFDF